MLPAYGAAAGRIKLQLAHDVLDDGLYRSVDRYRHRMFARVGRFQCPELAVEKPRRHEVPFAPGKPVRDQCRRAVEKDDADVTASMHQDVAISVLQRGTGDHRAL